MSNKDPMIDALFVEQFNQELASLNCAATVSLSDATAGLQVFELRDDEGSVVTFIPLGASPEMAAIAYRLYGQGLNRGVRVGEEAAWAKLRHLIGAVAKND